MARPRPTVLIVDDDGATRAGLAVLVENWGYQPIEAADGKSAVKICNDELPRAIVTDLMMPGMHTIGRPVETFIQFAGLIYGGVPEQFPKLRIAFLECGVGWVPYWMERMDEEWEKRGKIEAPRCKKKPSDYVKSGNLFFALEPEEETVPYVIERIGADKILFASDYPHWDGIFPHVVSTILGRKDISDDAKTQILGQNAKRFYGWQ